MQRVRHPRRVTPIVVAIVAAVLAASCSSSSGGTKASTATTQPTNQVRFERVAGAVSPGTPAKYNEVGAIETGSPSAKKVLILVPGTSASAAYFEPLAKDIVSRQPDWQVWSVERRENMLEDQSMFDKAKAGKAEPLAMFNYYLGYLTDPSVKTHFALIPDASVGYAKQWGMKVAVEDIHALVELAKRRGAKTVVLGGHSLGGSITTAYATWDFDGKAGADQLAGLVYDDGASGPTPVSPERATASRQALDAGSPWLAFGGIAAPYAGLFSTVGSALTKMAPDAASNAQSFSLLPANLKPPVPTTNEATYGYDLDVATSPASLRAAQAHLGQLAATGTPRGWDGAGALTPIQRFATMFSGWGLQGFDGSAWYHPMRLTIDSGAVADGNPNPAQAILDVDAIHGHDLPKALRIYAFGAALGGAAVPAAAQTLAQQSGIPADQLTLVDRHETYAHNDPAGASPHNEFLDGLVSFLHQFR